MTRGERNHNPFNLEDFGIPWQGLTGHDEDNYCIFDIDQNGLRAGYIDLRSAQTKHGLKTVRAIIGRFAPPGDNNTEAYIDDVCAHLGVNPDDPVDLSDSYVLQVFGKAVINHENGRCIYPDTMLATTVGGISDGTSRTTTTESD